MYEKLGRGSYFGRFLTADVFFLSCVSQDPDICGREGTFGFYLISQPQISQIVFLFADNRIQSKSFSFFIPRTFKERNWGIGQKMTFTRNGIGGEHMIP